MRTRGASVSGLPDRAASPRKPEGRGPANDQVLTAREAARFLKVSSDSLYAAANRGEVPHRRIGRRMVFSSQGLLAWLAGSSGEGEEAA